MIEFRSIEAWDTFSYRHLSFEFKSGLHSIEGLNGSSKTSIFLSLIHCLMNKNPKGCKVEDVSNKITGQPYCIKVTALIGRHEYCFINSKKTGTVEIYRDGRDVSLKRIPDNLKMIQEILNAEFTLLCDLIYQSKDSTLDILETGTDRGRKVFLNRILRLAEIDEQALKMKEKEKALTGKHGHIAIFESMIEVLQGSLRRPLEVGEEIETFGTECEIANLEDDLARLQSGQKEIEQMVAAHSGEYATAMVLKSEIARAEQSAANRLEHDRLQQVLNSMELPQKTRTECEVQLEKIRALLVCTMAEHAEIRKKLSSYQKAVKDQVCPTCGSAEQWEKIQTLVTELEQEEAEKEAVIEKCRQGEQLYRSRLKVWTEREKVELQIAKLSGTLINDFDLGQARAELQEREAEIARQEAEIAAVKRELTQEIAGKTERLRCLRSRLETVKSENATVRARKEFNLKIEEENGQKEQQIAEEKAKLAEAERQLDLIREWNGILGNKGYRVAKINRFLKALNAEMVKYSKMICGGRIRAHFFISAEGEVDFTITDAAKEMDYPLWSGGEKARVRLVCLFAVLELLEIMGSTCFNVLCLDEVFDQLDAEGKEGLFRVLEYLKQKGKAIYVIAHSELALDLAYDSVIKAVKHEDGTTTIISPS